MNKMFRMTRSGLMYEIEPMMRMERLELESCGHTQKSAAKFFKIPIHQVHHCKKGWKNSKTGEIIW
jgi:hypothetical protein